MSVSAQDLVDFHSRHLGQFHGTIAFDQPKVQTDAVDSAAESHVVGDSLGFYSDGVERTLTDEHIEFFRQSDLRKQELLLWRKSSQQFSGGESARLQSPKALVEPAQSQLPKALVETETVSGKNPQIQLSVEETEPMIPGKVPSNASYGAHNDYIQRLEESVDKRFSLAAEGSSYFPEVPL